MRTVSSSRQRRRPRSGRASDEPLLHSGKRRPRPADVGNAASADRNGLNVLVKKSHSRERKRNRDAAATQESRSLASSTQALPGQASGSANWLARQSSGCAAPGVQGPLDATPIATPAPPAKLRMRALKRKQQLSSVLGPGFSPSSKSVRDEIAPSPYIDRSKRIDTDGQPSKRPSTPKEMSKQSFRVDSPQPDEFAQALNSRASTPKPDLSNSERRKQRQRAEQAATVADLVPKTPVRPSKPGAVEACPPDTLGCAYSEPIKKVLLAPITPAPSERQRMGVLPSGPADTPFSAGLWAHPTPLAKNLELQSASHGNVASGEATAARAPDTPGMSRKQRKNQLKKRRKAKSRGQPGDCTPAQADASNDEAANAKSPVGLVSASQVDRNGSRKAGSAFDFTDLLQVTETASLEASKAPEHQRHEGMREKEDVSVFKLHRHGAQATRTQPSKGAQGEDSHQRTVKEVQRDAAPVRALKPSPPAPKPLARRKIAPKKSSAKVEAVIVLSSSDEEDEDAEGPLAKHMPATSLPGVPSAGPLLSETYTHEFGLSAKQEKALAAYLQATKRLARNALVHAVDRKYNIYRRDLDSLVNGDWLNDEMIMGYLTLEHQRLLAASASASANGSRKGDPACPYATGDVHVFNTYFYTTLAAHGYARVRRWLRRPTRSFRLLVVPINVGNRHWALATVEFPGPKITVYDSMASSPRVRGVHEVLLGYLEAEVADEDKHGNSGEDCSDSDSDSDTSDNEGLALIAARCPQQIDGSSCGVFAVAFAVCRMRGLPISEKSFNQSMQAGMRRRMAFELIGDGVRKACPV